MFSTWTGKANNLKTLILGPMLLFYPTKAINDQALLNKTCQAGAHTKYLWADMLYISCPSLDSCYLILLLYGLFLSAFSTMTGTFSSIIFFQLQNRRLSLFFPMKAADYLPNTFISWKSVVILSVHFPIYLQPSLLSWKFTLSLS